MEPNETFKRFQEVVEQLTSLLPKQTSNVYLKMGMRISNEIMHDLRKMPEEQIGWYCREFGAAMLYIATGRDPREILTELSIDIPTRADQESESS